MKTKHKTSLEKLGHLTGYLLGTLTFTGSFLRRARVFHPRGLLYRARVEPLTEELRFHPHALVRLSGALWKKAEWMDVLGVALRFSASDQFSEIPAADDQDLLLASFSSIPKLPISPFITDSHNFLGNDYYSVAPFIIPSGKKIWFRLSPFTDPASEGPRDVRLHRAWARRRANFVLFYKEKGGPWKRGAKIVLLRETALNQEDLAFDPFRSGLSWIPSGFVQHLRIGAYRLSRLARKRRGLLQERESALPSVQPS